MKDPWKRETSWVMSRVFSRPLAGMFHVSTTEITSVAGSLLQPTTSAENCNHECSGKQQLIMKFSWGFVESILATVYVSSTFLNWQNCKMISHNSVKNLRSINYNRSENENLYLPCSYCLRSRQPPIPGCLPPCRCQENQDYQCLCQCLQRCRTLMGHSWQGYGRWGENR